jgi:hypothetical protein
MSKKAQLRTKMVLLLGLLAVSSLTMLWLFWRFPISTAIATAAVLTAFGLSARLASAIDTDSPTDTPNQDQGLPSP